MPSQTPQTKLNFKIKLLSGNNVVLVDCMGYESELFIPHIVKGRITFQNIIPSHRCCDAAGANVQTGSLLLPASKLGDVAGAATPQRFCFDESGPLAKSRASSDDTSILRAIRADTSIRRAIRADKENIADNVQTGSLLLPASKLGDVRIVAGAATSQRSSFEVSGPLAKSTPSSNGIRMRDAIRADKENVSLLTPEQARCTPANMCASPISICIDDILPTLQTSSTSTVPNPALSSLHTPTMRSASASISGLTPKSGDTALCNFMHKAPPVRTYARCKATGTVEAPICWSPVKKKGKQSKVSSTKPPSPKLKLEVRHRKLIVDRNKTIAVPNAQKVTLSISKTQIQNKQVSAKTRQQFEALKVTAFDMLTSSVLSNISPELNKQFKEACVEKFCETLPSYAELSGTAPLQIDRQVQSLMAKEKRLERQMSKAERLRLQKSKKSKNVQASSSIIGGANIF